MSGLPFGDEAMVLNVMGSIVFVIIMLFFEVFLLWKDR